jgi:hypothetical protein
MAGQKPAGLGKGQKSSISGDPQDMGLNERASLDKTQKLRGETGSSQPVIKKKTISSDRGKFKCY